MEELTSEGVPTLEDIQNMSPEEKAELEAQLEFLRIDQQAGLNLAQEVAPLFPESSFRANQKEVLEEIDDAFRQGYQYVVVEAPTGFGKSAVAVALGRKYSADCMTAQLTLQSQYTERYTEIAPVKGRRSFSCPVNGETAAEGPCVTFRKPTRVSCELTREGGSTQHISQEELEVNGMASSVTCEYAAHLVRAINAQIRMFNYHSFYYHGFTDTFEPRPLMILDEAHNLESIVMNFVEIVIPARQFPKLRFERTMSLGEIADLLKPGKMPNERVRTEEDDGGEVPVTSEETTSNGLAGPYYVILRRDLAALRYEIRLESNPKERRKLNKKADEIVALLGKARQLWQSREDKSLAANWVYQFLPEKGPIEKIVLKPITVEKYVQGLFLARGNRALLMSATILDFRVLQRALGLPLAKTHFIRVPSTFPPENRPIHIYPIADLSYKNIRQGLPELMKGIERVLEQYPGKRGIIHSHTFPITEEIEASLGMRYPRLIFQHKGERREDILVTHANTEDGVIVAPAFHEGLDLVEDMSRFQIICKIPYPPMGDPQIKARMNIDEKWYAWLTLLKMVQSYGRSIRSETDTADTYILDSGFPKFHNRHREMMPPWFEDAIHFHSAVDAQAWLKER